MTEILKEVISAFVVLLSRRNEAGFLLGINNLLLLIFIDFDEDQLQDGPKSKPPTFVQIFSDFTILSLAHSE